MDAISLVIQKLHRVKKLPSGFSAECPAHDDGKNSLSVSTADDGRVLLHCHAGCRTQTIVAKIGLDMADLFPEKRTKTPKRIVATYDYRDESGLSLFQSVRFEPKSFAQRQSNGKGGWVWGLNRTRRVLYQLPQLIAANPSETVFVVEGEKDCDNLARLKLVATTNPMGAGKWRDEYTETLGGRNVVILADNDKPGRDHAMQVARSLHSRAATVRVLSLPGLPPKGDVSDWLAAGGSVAELQKLCAATPLYTPNLDSANVDADACRGNGHGPTSHNKSTAKAPSAAQLLVHLAQAEADLFHTAGGELYASVMVDSHRETIRLRNASFTRWLAGCLWDKTGRTASTKALAEARLVIEQMALRGEEREVFIRVAGTPNAIYVDLGDPTWRVVEIDANGWRVVPNPPVRFRRAPGMLPLPEPARGGTLEQLRNLLGILDDGDWQLTLGWLFGTYMPHPPRPVLSLTGEQGTGKSTKARMMRELSDPNESPERSAPRDERDLAISASNSWCVSLGNLSYIPDWLSDAICRLSTGGGFATRKLTTDDDEILFNSTRPVILNGIGEVATRGDLLDRSVLITLDPIADAMRKSEEELWRTFRDAQPGILGALYDAISGGLKELPRTRLRVAPRLADWARWCTAIETGARGIGGAFIAAYEENAKDRNETAIEASTVGCELLKLLALEKRFEGTAADLLAKLTLQVGEPKPKNWPRLPRSLSVNIRRLAPSLRAANFSVTMTRSKETGRRIVIEPKSKPR